jgi:C4-dicarboxylate-specific signal transduction histidine kinase
VLDLTERKRAEAELRETERRYSEVQMELAHANRLAIVGQLTASIAHEVKHPIAATVANATAGLRWLDGRSPNLEEVRQALTRIVKDGNRSTEVIDRIRALSRGRRHGGSDWRSMEQSGKCLSSPAAKR